MWAGLPRGRGSIVYITLPAGGRGKNLLIELASVF